MNVYLASICVMQFADAPRRNMLHSKNLKHGDPVSVIVAEPRLTQMHDLGRINLANNMDTNSHHFTVAEIEEVRSNHLLVSRSG